MIPLKLRQQRVGLALGAYLAGTLAVPLLNGAGGDERFWPHALVVLSVAAVLVALLETGAAVLRKMLRCAWHRGRLNRHVGERESIDAAAHKT